ncbi:uncharacterized protein LY89DRAFT_680729 [Mollisia scopiformis]|uniref:Uncharacterized protein n=1 Tax=Mollisia scopiformis TaxID=149040 RepID=A0A194XRA9_MOLSC|nr:uncharacterized protein LY89DRAFT_680729 [Mollisia scopiformis]KUJ22589.1 hypothetical protein LY89DRAFT_680729 [Mollisia scopiformis]
MAHLLFGFRGASANGDRVGLTDAMSTESPIHPILVMEESSDLPNELLEGFSSATVSSSQEVIIGWQKWGLHEPIRPFQSSTPQVEWRMRLAAETPETPAKAILQTLDAHDVRSQRARANSLPLSFDRVASIEQAMIDFMVISNLMHAKDLPLAISQPSLALCYS